jgi:hypothetical protein
MATDYLNIYYTSVCAVGPCSNVHGADTKVFRHSLHPRPAPSKYATVLRHPVHPLSAESWATPQGGLPRPDAVCGAWARVFALQKERTEGKGVYAVVVYSCGEGRRGSFYSSSGRQRAKSEKLSVFPFSPFLFATRVSPFSVSSVSSVGSAPRARDERHWH